MLFFHITLTLFLLAVFYLDMTRYIIPNWICGILLALYPVMLFMTPAMPQDHSILWAVGLCVIVFIFGIFIFAMKWAGGGDVKLLAVLALWTGKESTLEFVVYTGLLGGVLAIFLIMARPLVGRFTPVEKIDSIPRIFRDGEPLPYGLAITTAFLILLWMGNIAGLPVTR
ncbi:MAG: prepilin peptidase [Alphaproteobacteria bacterium]|nr:prepilin peptidase [Alphaproteobacteria bacterium]